MQDYKYLGTNIANNGKCFKEARLRIALAKKAFWKYKELLKSNISMSVKKMMIRNYIWSVVSYGSEAWTINKDIGNKINSFELWVYRRILKVNWKNRVSNKGVLHRMGIDDHLMDSIAKRKVAFFGHICRVSSREDFYPY